MVLKGVRERSLPLGSIGYVWRQFWLLQLGVGGMLVTPGIYSAETKDAAEHPEMPKTAPPPPPTTENYPVQDVNSIKVEKPGTKLISFPLLKVLPEYKSKEVVVIWTSLVAQMVKNLPVMRETWVQPLGWEDPWRRAWQPTPVFLPGEAPWTEEPGGLQSTVLPRVGQD